MSFWISWSLPDERFSKHSAMPESVRSRTNLDELRQAREYKRRWLVEIFFAFKRATA
ncbi:MAG: hypothetical protein QXH39_04370 [Conexivisphaerales archaeon]